MKDFLKFTFASLLGMLLFTVVVAVIAAIAVAGIVVSENSGAPVRNDCILRINLDNRIEEQAEGNPFSLVYGSDEVATYGLDDLLIAIHRATVNDKVKGIYLEGGIPLTSHASLQEIRRALLLFKQSGKFIYSYADAYSQGGYYICSVADTVMVNPLGSIDWHGMASEPRFYKDALERLGVRMQVFKVGAYKSAVEPYTNTSMSEANREQVSSYLFSIWGQMVSDVSTSRNISRETLNAYADSCTLFIPVDRLVQWRLADRVCYLDEVKASLRDRMALSEGDDLRFVDVPQMAKGEDPDAPKAGGDEVAVYYAYGDIVNTEASSLLNGFSHSISCDKVVKDLQGLRSDKHVKAVVLRVNSRGGSAYASEQLWREVELLKAEKPVVVSMGGYAASGGYYISSGADRIFAESTTLTGSIGIFGMVPDVSDLLTKKVGLRFDVVKTNALSDFGSLSRPMNDDECRLLQAEIERGYDTFVTRVAAGRKMTPDDVRSIAEGRVWTGEQALKIGLVDELGNLDDAVACAASMADLQKYSTVSYPAAEPWYKTLLKNKRGDYLDSRLRSLLGEYYSTFQLLSSLREQDWIQARLPFEPNIY